MATNVFARTNTTFEKFTQAVRGAGHTLTDAEVQKAATRFAVPVADVLALREEMLAQSGAATDDAGKRSRDLRPESGGVLGGTNNTGTGGGVKARLEAHKVKAPTSLPRYLDVGSVHVFWGVPLSSGQGAVATAILEDSKKNQVTLHLPLQGEDTAPKVSFLKRGFNGAVTAQPFGTEMARALLPLLDAAIASSPAPNGQGSGVAYGAAVAVNFREHCQSVLLAAGAPSQEDDIALFNKATALFDKGNHGKGEQMLTALSSQSAFPHIRAHAHFMLAEMQHVTGRDDEALRSVATALPSLNAGQRVTALEMVARIHNARRDFGKGKSFALRAVNEGQILEQQGKARPLTSAHFALAVAQKNLGEIDDAIKSMQSALASKPDATYIQLALAGYLGIAGKKDEAAAMFASIPVPPKDQMTFIDYNSNATWFHAVNRDEAKVMQFAEQALEAAKSFKFPGTVNYFKVETDLDWMRDKPAFQALLARFGG